MTFGGQVVIPLESAPHIKILRSLMDPWFGEYYATCDICRAVTMTNDAYQVEGFIERHTHREGTFQTDHLPEGSH